MRWRASLACCEDPPGQLERSREPARRRRRDPLARDLRPPRARWPCRRPGDERLAGERPARRARRHAGVPHRRTPQFRAARPAARARATPRRALRCGRRRHQQTAAVPRGHDPAAVLGDHSAPVRRDGVPGGELAGRGRGVGRRLRLDLAVRFLGFVSEEEKRRLLRRAWAVVFPSPKEGWGISNVEAAACGTPALASDSPGLRESVRHGETGYLVPHGDAPALAERMLALAADPGLVARLGRGGRAFAETLSWERTATATEAQLSRLLAEGG